VLSDSTALQIVAVRPDEYLSRAMPLVRQHWAETGFDFELDIDSGAYRAMTDAGVLFALAATQGDELVGYCTVVVVPHPFNRRVIFAKSDALFVAPEARRGLVAGRLIRAAEDEAKERGAARFLWHARAGTPFAAMLEAHGYLPADQVLMRKL
jgi:GNAT superfamily N-acetyltransferase